VVAYISIVWNPSLPHCSESARRAVELITAHRSSWTACYTAPGLCVLLPADDSARPPSIELRSGAGVLLGTIFDSDSGAAFTCDMSSKRLSDSQERDLVTTQGLSLIRSHWGTYVLFLYDRRTADICAFRGPMSTLPCFWIDESDITLFCSRPSDLVDLGLVALSINWDQIRAQSLRGDYLSEETALTGLHSIQSGECMTVRHGKRAHRTYWRPSSAPNDASLNDLGTASATLRSVTQKVLNSWCSAHRSLIISLSGGFDSSVLLSCLAHAPSKRQIRAVNFYSRGSGDERLFARSMASKYQVPLSEIELRHDADLSQFLNCSRTASPVLHFSAFATDEFLGQLSQESGASAVITGELGDIVFGHGLDRMLLAEAVWRYGLTSRTLRVILAYSVLYRVSVWHAIGSALTEYLAFRRSQDRPNDRLISFRRSITQTTLATDEAIAEYERTHLRFLHPWLEDATRGPPGWSQAIPSLISVTSPTAHGGFLTSSDTLILNPLVSQPLVELFLAIPGDLHITGSESAAVARHAFGDQLSSEVLGRGKGKGTPELWLGDVISHNRGFVMELLLDGLLVKERVLDRRKAAAALSCNINGSKVRANLIIAQLYIEGWLRQWTRPQPPPQFNQLRPSGPQ
jgi:asparagine synthase (glutamine-hydrolysing)